MPKCDSFRFPSSPAASAVLTVSAALAALAGSFNSQAANTGDWKDHTISPVANPIFFEDPHIRTEVRPIFIQHNIPNNFLQDELGLSTGTGGDVRVYAVQLRVALSDRLALIATKDGFIEFSPDRVLGHEDGWADLAAGFKYALVDNRASQFILTPGFTFEAPTGNERVFQGNGKGEWNVFLSAEKGWNDFHVTGNAGLRIPNDMDAETASVHYSLQLDYYTCPYFIPFAVLNGFSVISEGDELPLKTEGYDLINFGSSDASGWNGLLIGGGFRSRLLENVDLGFAYEKAVTSPKGLYDDRFTLDVSVHF